MRFSENPRVAKGCVGLSAAAPGLARCCPSRERPAPGALTQRLSLPLRGLAHHQRQVHAGQFDVVAQVTETPSDTITNTVRIATSNQYDQGDPGELVSWWSGHVEASDTQLDVQKWAWTCQNPCEWSSNPTLTMLASRWHLFLVVTPHLKPLSLDALSGSTQFDFLAIMSIMALSKKGGEPWA